MTIKDNEIIEQITQLDSKLEPDDPNYAAAAFLLASLKVGPVQYKIAHLLGMPTRQVSLFAHQARRNGIWKGGQIHAEWFSENGGIAFWCDVLVLTGMMSRA